MVKKTKKCHNSCINIYSHTCIIYEYNRHTNINLYRPAYIKQEYKHIHLCTCEQQKYSHTIKRKGEKKIVWEADEFKDFRWNHQAIMV